MKKKPVVAINMDCGQKPADLLYRIKSFYVDSVHRSGGIPMLVPPIEDTGLLKYFADSADAFLFIGGMDYPPSLYGEKTDHRTETMNPARARCDMELAKFAIKSGKSIFGICGGLQLVCISLGGKLIQHVDGHRPESDEDIYHSVRITSESRILKRIFGEGEIKVNSFHHQSLSREHVGLGLGICAVSDEGLVEAVEGTGKQYILGVQWHPERINPVWHREKIFADFIGSIN